MKRAGGSRLWLALAAAAAACSCACAQDLVTEVNFVEGDYYDARCDGGSDSAAPRYPARPMRFRRVTLFGCALPSASYAAALRAVNVTVTEHLGLVQVPSDARITAASLAGLPSSVDSLELKAAAGALVPHPAFLAPLDSLRSLWLERVRPDRLPPRLDILRLINTGIEVLPPEALTVVVLEVSEERLKSIAGSESEQTRACSRLRELTLARVAVGPVAAMTRACGALEALTLRALAAPALPSALLRAVPLLVSFDASRSRFSSLPTDLFASSPKLRSIALTDLGLESLPNGLFSGLNSLERLTLAQNRLRARDLPAVARAASLRDLDLSDNPLGDLCSPTHEVSVLAGLRRLQQLRLRRAGLTRACTSWLRDLRALRGLDLSGNAVASVHCADLLTERAGLLAFLDLSGNPLTRVRCSQANHDRAAANPRMQMAKLVLDSRLECDCGAYWLARMLRDRGLPTLLEPRCAARHNESAIDITKVLEVQCAAGEESYVPVALVVILAVCGALGGLSLAAAAALARPATRLRLKALLSARRRDPLDADRVFDAYVAHAEEDERFVAERLAAQLEPPRRLCLAYRNWPGGVWIPAQIDESVRRSRRTLCVVSRNFLASHRARAELRAAHAHALHDATPRLLLLLVDVSEAELDDELRAALLVHTHLRWGEPCFWEKLSYALPDPRPPCQSDPSPPVAA